jgi:hypothetical protein
MRHIYVNLHSIIKTANVVLLEKFQTFGFPQIQTVELVLLGVSSTESPVNVLDAVFVQLQVEQCCRSANSIFFLNC